MNVSISDEVCMHIEKTKAMELTNEQFAYKLLLHLKKHPQNHKQQV